MGDQLVETLVKLRRQTEDAIRCQGQITCECGNALPVYCMYKCLYCGRWFCRICAHKHFGSDGGPVPADQWNALISTRAKECQEATCRELDSVKERA